MKTTKMLVAVAGLWLTVSGLSTASAKAAELPQPFEVACPTPLVPYGITSACAHAISERSVEEARRFNPVSAPES